jgi:antitoxin component of MazEF toxin-antitoxin module
MVKFKAKIWKTGNSLVITIPDYLIKSDLVNPKKEQDVEINESKK